jgi:hypothetical protein
VGCCHRGKGAATPAKSKPQGRLSAPVLRDAEKAESAKGSGNVRVWDVEAARAEMRLHLGSKSRGRTL